MQEHSAKTGIRPIPKIRDAAKTNPNVDVGKLREAQRLLDELRKAGVSPKEYDLSSPYRRRPPSTVRGPYGTRPQPL